MPNCPRRIVLRRIVRTPAMRSAIPLFPIKQRYDDEGAHFEEILGKMA